LTDWKIEKPDADEKGCGIAHQWIQKRGLNWDILEEKAHIRAVYVGRDYGGVGVAVPMFGVPRQNEIIRICRPKNIRYLNPAGKKIESLFNAQVLNNNDNPVIITEGITDALTMIQIKPLAMEVVSIPGTLHAGNVELFEKLAGRVVLIAMDNDEPGEKAANELIKNLHFVGAKAVQKINIPPQFNDINEWFINTGETDILIEVMTSYARAVDSKKKISYENSNEKTAHVIFTR